jgi:predicted glycosyltransferase
MIVPDHAVDGLSLIWSSDLVISGGGTMNREAASLGVPVYSIFRGTIGAVDRYLAERGRLTLIETPKQVHESIRIVQRTRSPQFKTIERPAHRAIIGTIVWALGEERMRGPRDAQAHGRA